MGLEAAMVVIGPACDLGTIEIGGEVDDPIGLEGSTDGAVLLVEHGGEDDDHVG